jgi:hypothetical protein
MVGVLAIFDSFPAEAENACLVYGWCDAAFGYH